MKFFYNEEVKSNKEEVSAEFLLPLLCPLPWSYLDFVQEIFGVSQQTQGATPHSFNSPLATTLTLYCVGEIKVKTVYILTIWSKFWPSWLLCGKRLRHLSCFVWSAVSEEYLLWSLNAMSIQTKTFSLFKIGDLRTSDS